MEPNKLQQFENVPTSFLTEVSEAEMLQELNKEQAQEQAPAPEPEKKPDFLDIEGPAEGAQEFTPFGPKVGLNNFLSDELGTELYDAIVTAIAVTALNFAGVKATKSELSFTAKEKSTLKPIIKECIDSLNIKFTNPWEALGWTTLLLVGTKIVTTKGEEIAEKFKAKPSLKKVVKAEKEKTESKKQVSKYMAKKYGPDGKPKND
jgi:hypothetical protein